MRTGHRSVQQRSRAEVTCRPVRGMLLTAVLVLLGTMPAHAQEVNRPDFEGMWLSPLIIFDDPRWRIEDILCSYCAVEVFEHLQSLLADPANDDRSLEEIEREVRAYNLEYYISLLTSVGQKQYAEFDPADDPTNRCEPVGLIRQVLQPLPWKIEQYDERVVFRFEYEDTVRTIYMDGRNHPVGLTPSRLGHAIGWYDEETLVIETRGLASNIYAHIVGKGMQNSTGAVTIERYTKSADENRLDVEFTVVDPLILRQPLTISFSWLSIPDGEFQEYVCEADSGEL